MIRDRENKKLPKWKKFSVTAQSVIAFLDSCGIIADEKDWSQQHLNTPEKDHADNHEVKTGHDVA